jgi:hypothetical protein
VQGTRIRMLLSQLDYVLDTENELCFSETSPTTGLNAVTYNKTLLFKIPANRNLISNKLAVKCKKKTSSSQPEMPVPSI